MESCNVERKPKLLKVFGMMATLANESGGRYLIVMEFEPVFLLKV